ncbi:MAG: transglutaminase family protein [Verrucomicrobiota bacterium]
MKYHVRHRTTYKYPEAVSESHHLARLHPRSDSRQQCLSHTLTILPEPAVREERTDAFGNQFTFFALQAAYEVLMVEAISLVETYPVPPPDMEKSPPWEMVAEKLAEDHRAAHLEAQAFRFPTQQIPVSTDLADYARLSFTPGRRLLEAAMALTTRIFREFKFDPSATTIATPVETVLREKRGVCQDFAHLEIACLRSLGLAVRYVSGYLETLPPPGKPRQVGADASHAWISVYDPVCGWVDFDPTNNCIPGPLHLRTAWGRDFSDVSPLRGVTYGGGGQQPKVMVDVIPQPPDEVPPGAPANAPVPANTPVPAMSQSQSQAQSSSRS